VREITVDDNGMASGVIYYDEKGVEHFQPAEMVILACNGVGTPRLMLNSKSERFPDGIRAAARCLNRPRHRALRAVRQAEPEREL
jgi:succinate dehydrogenase/fumarate reductase flavoprotein subunit